MPLGISGPPIYLPQQPGAKACPHCRRRYSAAEVKADGKNGGIYLSCPFCGGRLSEEEDQINDSG